MQLLHFILPITIVLSACASPQQDIENMEQLLTERLNAEKPQSSTQQATRISDASFELNLRNAVLRNDSFSAARAMETAAFAQMDVAKSSLMPQISTTATGGSLFEGSPTNARTSGVAADLMITQLVYDGGASGAAIDGAMASALSARAGTQEIGNNVALEAVKAWADVWVVQQQLKTLTTRSQSVKALFDQIETMTSGGMIDSATRDSARLMMLDIEIEEARLRSTKAEAESRFEQYFGILPAADLKRPTLLSKEKDIGSFVNDLSSAPSLRKAAADLLAADAAVDQARAQFKPTITLNSGISSPMDVQDSTNTRVGLQLRYTLSDGGKRKAQVDAAIARRDSMAAKLADAKAQAKTTLASTLSKLETLSATEKLGDQKLLTTAAAAAAGASQIASGQTSLNGLIDAEIKQFRAFEQNLNTISARVVLQATILAGTGALLKQIGAAE